MISRNSSSPASHSCCTSSPPTTNHKQHYRMHQPINNQHTGIMKIEGINLVDLLNDIQFVWKKQFWKILFNIYNSKADPYVEYFHKYTIQMNNFLKIRQSNWDNATPTPPPSQPKKFYSQLKKVKQRKCIKKQLPLHICNEWQNDSGEFKGRNIK